MMSKTFSALAFFLCSLSVLAQETASGAPAPGDASPMAMVVVILLLVGMTGGFIWFIWWKDQRRKRTEAQNK